MSAQNGGSNSSSRRASHATPFTLPDIFAEFRASLPLQAPPLSAAPPPVPQVHPSPPPPREQRPSQRARRRAQTIDPSLLGFNYGPSSRSERTYPLGFLSEQQWRDETRPIARALRAATGTEHSDTPPPLFIAGSSVTGKSYADKPDRPAGTPFDRDSDWDFGVASPELHAAIARRASEHLSHDDGPAKTRALHARELDEIGEKGLANAVGRLQQRANRAVSIAVFESDNSRQANAGRPYIERPHTPPPDRK
jgi:hypothetical protein